MARFHNLELDPAPDEPDRLKRHPDAGDRDEQYWLRLADENRRQGHHENALRFYSRALELDKSLAQGWLGQVQMLIALDECPEAELWARKALELFRNHGDLLAARSQALARLGNRSEALALCDGAIKQEGQSAYRWVVRGELLVRERRDLDRHCFDKAMLLDRDWLVPLEIAAVYAYYQLPGKAAGRLRQAAELAPDNPYVWYRRACCELELGLEGAARKSLRQCVELAPNHVGPARLWPASTPADGRPSAFWAGCCTCGAEAPGRTA
jgi:tetratricopeptide (TPR) repeat protein